MALHFIQLPCAGQYILNILRKTRAQTFWRYEIHPTEAPIRAELFSVERLEQHAESLAAAQRIALKPRHRRLAQRLNENTRILIEAYRTLAKATNERQPITPAAEWFLDNFHLVDEQIREINDDLPPGFYRELPKLADGPLQGYPRVFGIAWALVAHTDSAFEIQKLTSFVKAYQRVQPLTIGELWAIAITLRITLVENLRRLAEAIAAQRAISHLADVLADRILGTSEREPEPVSDVLLSLNRAPWSMAFAVQLTRRLRDHDPNATPALRWLNERLEAEGLTTDSVVRDEVQQQSAMNVTIRNVIMSMRLVSTVDWAEFFESVSIVDAILRDGSDFAAMDFSTRDLYRRAIEEIARGSDLDEVEVAHRAIAAAVRAGAVANKAKKKGGDGQRTSDPGYYLISAGRRAFEQELACRVPLKKEIFRLGSTLGVMSYVGMIGVVTALVLAAALLCVGYAGIGGWPLVVLAIVGFVPASDVAVAVVNRVVTQQIGASLLPGLELRDGIPQELATIVVIPTLLTTPEDIERNVESLELHHLSNPDDNLCFALLSDWKDCETEQAPDDAKLLVVAVDGIARLNARYGPSAYGKRFFLLHRRRMWNEGEDKWMGWERKRGKLNELNRLLRGAIDTSFVALDGVPPALPVGIRYVITLDADTRLPIGSIRRLVGKIAQPLNRPRFDPRIGRVVEGHAILQPRVTPSLPVSREGSLYQRAFSGPNGLDPYALAVSDVYQDLFGEGSYCGKGIYEVDVFEAAVRGQIPDNTVLSHDLLEGIFARAALVSDIEVVEEFPSRYSVSAARQHRWVRGDWQLLPWIFAIGRRAREGVKTTPIPLMGRWKLLDNLRRSLSAPAALLAMLVGWWQPVVVAGVWTAYIVLTIALPPLLPAIAHIVPRRPGVSLSSHLRTFRGDLALGLTQSAFLLTFLAHQAWTMVDAVGRTLFRVFIRRRRLLEWVTAAQVGNDHQFDRRMLSTQIAASVVFVAVAAFVIYFIGHRTLLIAAPFGALWVLSPLVARWASLPPPLEGHLRINRADARALRLIARRTWRFFERFVTADSNMLPPDNFQEDPKPVVANRTSPTNLGLYLLSVVSARDLGWLGMLDATERLEATLATMGRLEQFRGHFFNWYDTTDLRPLEPKYISAVDSGNLAGHLIALGNACHEIVAGPTIDPCWVAGLEDALELIRESLSAAATDTRETGAADSGLQATITEFAAALRDAPESPAGIARMLDALAAKSELIAGFARKRSVDAEGDESEIVVWAEALGASVRAHQRDISFLMPWAKQLRKDAPDNHELAALLATMPTLVELPDRCEEAIRLLTKERMEGSAQVCSETLANALRKSITAARLVHHRLATIAETATTMFQAMEFGFLFNTDRQLLSIGYRLTDGSLDPNFYDLLASEARLASFVAIAKGDLPAKHWFRLGRTLTPIDGGAGLISWSGSMFEYLMPSLVMRAPSGSLLEQTNRLVVRRQEEYGDELGVPWGMSESEYNARDIEHTYQYSSFGVPTLGYKRGLGENVVVAPYASGLASMVDPASAARNFRRLADIGARGAYGWFEALDYTPARLPAGAALAIIRAYMAHHQAMIIVAIVNALQKGRMRARFHSEPIIQAAELLLQERMPRDVVVARPPPEPTRAAATQVAGLVPQIERRYTSAHSRVPRTHLMSNGRYSTMVTAVGSGYSRWHDIAITRWREDATRDDWGSYVFLRDVHSDEAWSAGYQPSVTEPDSYEASFHEDRVEITRRDGSITTKLEVAISPEDDAEVRRVSITNHGIRTREIDITSYAEVALARPADDAAHPAFAKLFVETSFEPTLGAILATRRQRSPGDPLVWAAHMSVLEGEPSDDVQFETDRARFLGRGQTVRSPVAITDGWPLSNTTGAVLDPIFCLRRRVRIARGATARIAFWTLAAASREDILDLADKHHDTAAFARATTSAWTQAQMQLHHLRIGADEAHLFQRLANHVLYLDPSLRAPADAIKQGLRESSRLWAHGISGDLPIILVRVQEDEDQELVRQLLRAHEYWRLKQLAVDLVILNERAPSYVRDLQTGLEALVRMNQSMPKLVSDTARGDVFVLRGDLVAADIKGLLQAAARAVLVGGRGTLAEQVDRARDHKSPVPPPKLPVPRVEPEATPSWPQMEYFNGLGGFTVDGREYLTLLNGNERTPTPWINVIANSSFGFQVSTEGSGFTWSVNSQQNQLTPWSNDPVGDAPGEALYVRDEVTGEVWGPTALPIRIRHASYSARHGQGYSRFEHVSHGIGLELLQYVPTDDPIKISRLKITNQSGRERHLSVTAYVEWVLGGSRAASAPFIVTAIDPETGAIFAQNQWNDQFGGQVAFADLNGMQTAWTGDRTEFIGRDGALERPLGLTLGTTLSNRVGVGFDPCGVLQTSVRLAAGDITEIVFFLGQATRPEAQALIGKYRMADLDTVFDNVNRQWDETLGTVQVRTPERSLDILLNRWLPYQTVACRLWARTGFYQASGAYGFRDQLQDVMALCVSRPDLARAHILRAAAR
jgi:cyclic beta-1,2-glucan synthetase